MHQPLIAIGVQCRLTSSRLPCKALLKLEDTTVVGMCIQRAKHTGHPVFVLTSDQEEDDLVADTASECGVDGIIRGSLDNVMSRYISLAQEISCEYIIRVTGDNPLTEYKFVNPLIKYTYLNSLPYAWIEPGLCPEGSNIEIFSKEALLESANADRSDFNLEHVTAYMRRNLSSRHCLKEAASHWLPFDCKQLSFTIDTLSDYVKISKLINSASLQKGLCWRDSAFVKACAVLALSKDYRFALGRNHALA